MPKRDPVKKESTEKIPFEEKVPVETEALAEEKAEGEDPPKPKRKRRKKKASTTIKLEVTEEIAGRFETVFTWYRSEKKDTATPNGFALEVFELGLKGAESQMAGADKEEGISWDCIPEVLEAKKIVDEDDEEPGYDPDFEEAFQNYCTGNL